MTEVVRDVILALDYRGIALLMVVMAPELVMPFAGFVAADGYLSLLGVLLAGTAGAVIGSTALYAAARAVGEARVRVVFVRAGRWVMLREGDLDAILRAFLRHGDALVFFGRFLPTVRSLVSIPAGLVHMPVGRFLLFTAGGTAAWNAGLVVAGYILGEQRERLVAVLGLYEFGVTVLFIALIAAIILRRMKRRLMR